ncbi:hypothetical protein LCGC14_2060900 [marine sediment metagenome]|uniref:Tetratricopeptide repeat protein n=1 Tax=marine sediment metagenome TaxID=412755 RepID=A0A0F9F8N3_9ZZZZ
MAARAMLPLLCMVTLSLAADTRPAAPAAAPADELAVRGLIHAARSLGHLRGGAVVARAGRMGALLLLAERLRPDDLRANYQLVDLYEGLGDLARAARASRRYLKASPNDYAAGVRWIRLSLAGLDRAEQRIEQLKAVIAQQHLAKEIRAVAAGELCNLYLRQDDKVRARAACRQALALDPHYRPAIEARRVFDKSRPPVADLRDALTILAGNPRGMYAAWKVAGLCRQGGLHAQALRYYEHAYRVALDKRPRPEVLDGLVIDYVNALLDLGRSAEAIKLTDPLMGRHGWSLDLRALLVEACRAAGKPAQADAHIKAMDDTYKPLAAPGAVRDGGQAADLAWFTLHFKRQPKPALGNRFAGLCIIDAVGAVVCFGYDRGQRRADQVLIHFVANLFQGTTNYGKGYGVHYATSIKMF